MLVAPRMTLLGVLTRFLHGWLLSSYIWVTCV